MSAAAPGPSDAGRHVAVLGTFPSMTHARRAIEALQFAGVEAAAIALDAETAATARAADRERDTSARDVGMLRRIVWLGIIWGVVGAVFGAIVGLAVGSLDILGGDLAIHVAGWAMFFHILGTLIGAYAGISSGPAWEMTFQRVDARPVRLRVRALNAVDVRRIETVLRQRGADDIETNVGDDR